MKSLEDIASILRERRRAMNLTQKDMLMKIGMSQQQYQRIESGGDARLSTLLRVLEGMDLELMLVPKDRAIQLQSLLDSKPENQQNVVDATLEMQNAHSYWDDVFKKMGE